MATTDDHPKYAVLKWDDWIRLRNGALEAAAKIAWPEGLPDHILVHDAEVIRKQDATSGPVFHLYANLIQAYQDLLDPRGEADARLTEIADHFHNAALDADQIRLHGKSKLPD